MRFQDLHYSLVRRITIVPNMSCNHLAPRAKHPILSELTMVRQKTPPIHVLRILTKSHGFFQDDHIERLPG